MILLNPGPVNLSPGVRAALGREDLCHREPEFAALLLELKRRLVELYPESAQNYRAVVLAGSGTCAVEAMVTSLVPLEGTALLLSNGAYGERIGRMLLAARRPFEVVESAWDQPWNLEALGRKLRSGKKYSRILAVHHETTSGRLNELEALGELASRRETPILLDAVSSFGAEDLRLREWNVEACAGVANKCLHGAPGLSFVVARGQALSGACYASSVYLDLHEHDSAQEAGSCLFTLPTHLCAALVQALDELRQQGGPAARRRAYLQRFAALEDSIALAGHLPLVPEPVYRSSVLRSYKIGNDETYQQLHDRLKALGFVIYAGLGRNQTDTFRVSLMGEIPWSEISRLSGALVR